MSVSFIVKCVLPFVIMGVCLILVIRTLVQNRGENITYYLSEGMCLGLCCGISIAAAWHLNMSMGLGLGALIGAAVGIRIQK